MTFICLVFQCKKQYCDKKCDFGNKLDDYGCETCECIDPCEHVSCGKMETCIKGVCGMSNVNKTLTLQFVLVVDIKTLSSFPMRAQILRGEMRLWVQT